MSLTNTEKSRRWRERNPGWNAEYQRRYRARNLAKIRAGHRLLAAQPTAKATQSIINAASPYLTTMAVRYTRGLSTHAARERRAKEAA